jgi:uncharacterized glyoxalase superfamily protein PhnB
MKLTDLRPLLWTPDVKATITFYTDILGFTCDAHDEEIGWASLSRDAVTLMVSRPNAHFDFNGPVFTGSFYFSTEDARACWEQVKDKAKVCYPLEEFSWGMREFAIYDNNGYLLQFGQELAEEREP